MRKTSDHVALRKTRIIIKVAIHRRNLLTGGRKHVCIERETEIEREREGRDQGSLLF